MMGRLVFGKTSSENNELSDDELSDVCASLGYLMSSAELIVVCSMGSAPAIRFVHKFRFVVVGERTESNITRRIKGEAASAECLVWLLFLLRLFADDLNNLMDIADSVSPSISVPVEFIEANRASSLSSSSLPSSMGPLMMGSLLRFMVGSLCWLDLVFADADEVVELEPEIDEPLVSDSASVYLTGPPASCCPLFSPDNVATVVKISSLLEDKSVLVVV